MDFKIKHTDSDGRFRWQYTSCTIEHKSSIWMTHSQYARESDSGQGQGVEVEDVLDCWSFLPGLTPLSNLRWAWVTFEHTQLSAWRCLRADTKSLISFAWRLLWPLMKWMMLVFVDVATLIEEHWQRRPLSVLRRSLCALSEGTARMMICQY